MDQIKPYIGRTLRIFISYSSEDKELAGKFKASLDDYGFETFLAHEDIEFGAEWEEKIIQEIERCDIFLPLLTKDFKNSEWTSQEIGVAFELNKKILPIKIDMDPYGFIRGIQALRFDKLELTARAPSLQLIEILKKDKVFTEGLKDTLIRGFVNAGSFDSANAKAGLLREIEEFNIEQVNEIIRGALINSPEFFCQIDLKRVACLPSGRHNCF